ncbi:MAG: hypothetical protein IRZ03_17675 [Acidobacterium ailaaui]|nr:hypothetical protein [Pseudacidobacterium ailaaui]
MKHFIIVGMILTVAMLITLFACTPYKYERYTLDGKTIPLKINRFTGETFVYNAMGGRWVKLKND